MTKNSSLDLEGMLPGRNLSELQRKLLDLLAHQAERYTAGDSSSIRIETAQELLRSLCFCLGIVPNHPGKSWDVLSAPDLLAEWKKGLKRIEEKLAYGQSVWHEVSAQPLRLANDYLAFTLYNIPAFWKRYDSRFFAHEIPCDIDYPLAVPVPDELLGVDYVNCYLERLLIELRFLAVIPLHQSELVLDLYCLDHRKMFINLFEPIWTNALGCTLAGRNGKELLLCRSDLDQLCRMFENCPRERIEEKLIRASESLMNECGLQDSASLSYVEEYCRQLAVRIHSVLSCGGLESIFISHHTLDLRSPI